MLLELTNDGTATWTCPHCQTAQDAHVSHPQMEWTPRQHLEALLARGLSEAEAQAALSTMSDMVALPPCDCGTRTFLKTSFTAEELNAPNMRDERGNLTESHAAAQRHMALVGSLAQAGKPKPTN